MVSPNSLANLRPPFRGHNNQPRASAAVLKAITKCRKLAPEMVEFAAAIAHDEKEDAGHRLRAIEILLNKAMPVGKDSPAAKLDHGPSCIRIEIVDPKGEYGDPMDVTPNANLHGDNRHHTDSQQNPIVRLPAPRQEAPVVRNDAKVPTFRARNAAGIFR